jgi:hypothetical protein
MAGPLDIQRFPYGLVDLLGMKGSGDTPHTLAQDIAVTLADGADYYLAPRREIVTALSAIAFAATGWVSAVGLGPAAGECWLVYNVTASVNQATAAATAVRFCGTISKNGGLSQDVQVTESMSLVATDWDGRGRSFERPLVMLPGDVFGFRVFTITGAPNCRGRITADIARLIL